MTERTVATTLKLVCCLFLASLAALAHADDAKPLDDLLFQDLDNELLEGLDDVVPELSPDKESQRPANPALDDKLLEELGEGSEKVSGEPENPIAKIGERMKKAESLIGQQDTSERTQQVQKQITDDLAALIEQVSEQCCKNGQGKPGNQPGGQAGQQPGDAPSRDSTNRLGERDDKAARLAASRELLKQVWGHLPPQVRQQLMNASVEEFLPKYEKLIEDYYKRLAESEL